MKSSLIAHRGEPESWPENSLPGFEAVLRAGACYIETDIQITADGIAILSHDPSVLKVTGTDLQITATDYRTLGTLPAGHPERFSERFNNLRIARLDELVELLRQWPRTRAFIELKDASLSAHGIPTVLDTVMAILEPVLAQCSLISFNYEVLEHARECTTLPVGWVLQEWNTTSHARANALAPDYLFCNRKRLPPATEPLWPGPWQWAIYTVNDAHEAGAFLQRGAQLIETNIITRLLADPGLDGDGCA